MKVLVFCEQRDKKLKSYCLEALTLANQAAGGQASNVAALIVGNDIKDLATKIQGWGADKVYTAEDSRLHTYNPFYYASALETAIKTFQPDAVIGIASPMGKDLFARVAARISAPLLTDLVKVEDNLSGGTKPMYSGKVLAKYSFSNSGLRFLNLRPNVFTAKESSGKAEVESLNLKLPDDVPLKTIEIRKGKSEKPDLSEAVRIVSGGRSLGSAEKFSLLYECADVLGATVGASRAAVDSGYASHDMQVGQTGKTVNPTLYIACGISGAIQHLAGMRTSKVVVAINTDPDAPIFSIATYGIVADLFEAVPILTKKLKQLLD